MIAGARRDRLPGRGDRPHRARHDDHHQRRAGAAAGEDRHDHHARLSRRDRARPPHPAAALRHDRRLRAGHPAQSAGSKSPSASRRPARCASRSTRTRCALRSAVCVDAGCESLVIHFLHSYANPAHERRAAEIAAEIWPNGYITMGHALLSEAREFERGVTAAVNAAVQPILERYVERLRSELAGRGYARDFLIMNGNGGMISARFVTREAAKTVMSGPASGVIAAAYTGRRAGFRNLVTYDMGGTSTDVALIRNAEPAVSNEIEIEYAMPIHVPMVDVHTVGAGGGSIARVDASGLIQVGPESAGANPGPDLLRPRRHGADHHRRQSGARPADRAASCLSVDAPVTVDDVRQIFADRIGRADRPRRRRRGGRGAEARQHEDGRRDPHGVGGARPRSARLRAVRLRRRRAAACHRAGPRARPAESAGAGAAGHHQCARLRRRRSAPRFRQHAQPAGGDARRGARDGDPRAAHGRRRWR